jgi:hypothetical protein
MNSVEELAYIWVNMILVGKSRLCQQLNSAGWYEIQPPKTVFNPLPVQFKSLLPGQEGCVFFQWAVKFTYLPVRFSAFTPAGGI